MTLFSMDGGIKRVFNAVHYGEISEEIELAKHRGWIIYDAAGYDTIEMVKEIIYSVDYIDKISPSTWWTTCEKSSANCIAPMTK